MTSPDESTPEEATAQAPGVARKVVVAGGLWNAAAAIVPMASTLLLSVAIGRYLGDVALGDQSYVQFVAGLANSLIIVSFTTASMQVLGAAKGRGDAGRTARLERWSLTAHTVAAAFSAAFLVSLGLTRGGPLAAAWYVASVCTITDALGWALSARIAAAVGWSVVGPRRLLAQSAASLLGLGLLFSPLEIIGVFVGQAIASLGFFLSLAWYARRHRPRRAITGERPEWRPLVRLWGLFVLTGIITQVVERRIEVVFLEQWSGAAQIAAYSVAFNLVSIAFLFCASLTSAAVPSIAAAHAAGEGVRVVEALGRALRILLTSGILLTAGVVAAGPSVVLTFYGRDFGHAAVLVPFLAASIVLTPIGHLCSNFWTGTARMAPVLTCGAVAVVIDVAVAFALIPSWGAAGAVAANVASQCSGAVLVLIYTRRRLGGLEMQARRIVAPVVTGVVAGGAGWWAARALESTSPVLGAIAASLVWTVCVLLVGRTVGLLHAEDAAWLAGALPGRVGGLVGRTVAGRASRRALGTSSPRHP